MSKKRLPLMEPSTGPLMGRNVEYVTVGSWVPSLDGTGIPQCVALSIHLATGEDLVCRLKSPRVVDEIIQSLLRHKRDVWPDAP